MKIKINHTTLTENTLLNFFYKLGITSTLALFMLKIFIKAPISWLSIFLCLCSSLYLNKQRNNASK
ncbi:hypothetical protein SAMN04487886_10149 [Clostridium sp. DSM 8431]|nr:hypothetical protein SAMN04487886_10149 [Clostridium sp. DSM 8431]